jgi:DNA ligase (NAD+)
MDIEGMGEQLSFRLVHEGLVRTLSDIYELPSKRAALLELAGIGEKTLDALFANIEASKRQPLHRLLIGLSIRHVGGETARALARHFGTMEALRAATLEEVQAVGGIGPIVAESVRAGLDDERTSALIDRLAAAGVRQDEELASRGGPLEGLQIVVTGALDRWSRNEIEGLIKGLGGKIGTSVTKNTSYLVTGDGGGSKRTKAEQLGTPILDEAGLLELLGAHGWTANEREREQR